MACKPEVKIWRRTSSVTQRPPLQSGIAIRGRYSQVVTTSGFAVWQRRLFSRGFRIMVNFTTFRTISGIFESTFDFWILLKDHIIFCKKHFYPSMCVMAAIRARIPRKGASRGATGQTGSRNMAVTQFFDSATPTSYSTSNTSEWLSRTVMEFYRVKTKSRPEYTTTSCLTRRHFAKIFRITVNFTTFRTISSIFGSTSGFGILLPVHRFRFGCTRLFYRKHF